MRYSRQEIFIGSRNQKKLRKALVAIVGSGGTGSVAAEYLARAGINLRLIDRDIVELSNIQRQFYREEDVGRPKAAALKERLEETNSEIKIDDFSEDLNGSNIEKLLDKSTFILDGTDNMRTRLLINDYCLREKIPFSYGAAIKSEGLFTVIIPDETACLRCFIPGVSQLDTCETVGVLGPIVGMIGVISAMEAIKHITGKQTIKNRLLHINAYKNIFELLEVKKNRDCAACNGNYEFLNKPTKEITQLCGGTYQILFSRRTGISNISNKLKKNREFKILGNNKSFSQFSYGNYIVSLFANRMIIQNAKSEKEAKILKAKIVGF